MKLKAYKAYTNNLNAKLDDKYDLLSFDNFALIKR